MSDGPSVLVVNVGSSTVKLAVVGADDAVLGRADLDRPVDDAGLDAAISSLPPADAVGHRFVHGGPTLTGPVLLDDAALATVEACSALAPLHNPPALDMARRVAKLHPDLPAVGCFDTGFHAGIGEAARTYALPVEWRERWGLRRYGFHGLSHRWAARRTGELLGADGLRLVSCHLGAGCSLAAVADGRSVDTTMGFTPLEGLVMATRSGSVDPGLVLWLQREQGLTAAEVEDGLEHRSGLLGLSARSGDVRDVLAGAAAGDAACRVAIEVYVHRIRQGIAAMAASLGGVDAVVLTGGVGEHQPAIRSLVVDGLGFVGLAIDPAANDAAVGVDAVVSPEDSVVAVATVVAREDVVIAEDVRSVLAGPST